MKAYIYLNTVRVIVRKQAKGEFKLNIERVKPGPSFELIYLKNSMKSLSQNPLKLKCADVIAHR